VGGVLTPAFSERCLGKDMNCVYADLDPILRNLMCLSTFLATPSPRSELSRAQCAYTPDTAEVEKAIDDYATELTSFILPIGYFHTARAQARVVELLFWEVVGGSEADPIAQWGKYLNRISDLLFAIAVYSAAVFGNKLIDWSHEVNRNHSVA
jgi:cob(I)alamin adenosyltransferase